MFRVKGSGFLSVQGQGLRVFKTLNPKPLKPQILRVQGLGFRAQVWGIKHTGMKQGMEVGLLNPEFVIKVPQLEAPNPEP